MPETERYTKYSNLVKAPLEFTATYVKNGICPGSLIPTMLFLNVCYNGEQVLDHVWVRSKNDLHKKLRKKQQKQIRFIGKLTKITKLKDQSIVTKDLNIRIQKLIKG